MTTNFNNPIATHDANNKEFDLKECKVPSFNEFLIESQTYINEGKDMTNVKEIKI